MRKVRLLPGERIEARLKPHPASFAPQYLLAASFGLWGAFLAWMVRTNWWATADTGKWYQFWTFLYGNTAMTYVFTIAALALIGVIASLLAIRWRIFFGWLIIGLAATIVNIAWLGNDTATIFPILLAAVSVPGVLLVDLQRRSHKYVLTNLRILFRGGAFIAKERQLRYEAITDLDTTQGLFGMLFNYGTIIPVTQSGFGLGTDTSQAQMMVGMGAQKGPMMGGVGVAAGGGKEVQTGRARTFHQLTGVRPYDKTKYLLERMIQASTSTPYLQQQVELQQQMANTLQAMQARDVPAFQHAQPGMGQTPPGHAPPMPPGYPQAAPAYHGVPPGQPPAQSWPLEAEATPPGKKQKRRKRRREKSPHYPPTVWGDR